MVFVFWEILFLIVLFFIFRWKQEPDSAGVTLALSYNNTTVMRGFAILFVVIHHTATWLGWQIPIGGGGVAIFLFLSGYGLTMSFKKNGIKLFWWKRMTGVFLPWIIANPLAELI